MCGAFVGYLRPKYDKQAIEEMRQTPKEFQDHFRKKMNDLPKHKKGGKVSCVFVIDGMR